MSQQPAVRIERDTMGEVAVPAHAYYGAQTQRAVLNFPISRRRFPRRFIQALGLIKRVAAEVNRDLGLLDAGRAQAIIQAAQEVADGRWDDQFVVDVFQTGSGTSTNMNANEVIARRAMEIAPTVGRIHPNDHVNLGQSSNDVIPTAIHLSVLMALRDDLRPALELLHRDLRAKAEEFWPIIKTGRTHLMDATPIRLGQEFLGYAGQIERALRRLRYAEEELSELALGGTAVGTGVNTHPEFGQRAARRLAELTGLAVRETDNHFQAQAAMDGAVLASGVLNTIAVSLMKIANDIRLMGSGPRAGLFELLLPAVQPGSSIMPGKVNPVIPEALIQVCAQVMANHQAVTLGGQWGFFELNTMLPLIADNLLESVSILANAVRTFSLNCVQGLQATGRGPELVEKGLMMATALAPVLGYDRAAAIARKAFETGRTIREIAREETDLTDEQLAVLLDPARLVEPGLTGAPVSG